MNNEERDRALYKYPSGDVLRNKLNIHDAEELERAERLLVLQRFEEGAPTGEFDLDHLCAIHRHLFQDIYEWAGELRQVDFYKTDWFHPYGRIELGMADIHSRLVKQQFLLGLSRDEFAAQAGIIIGDVNVCHPFREGNGSTQLAYLKQLAEQADHEINLTRLERESWIKASIAANRAEYDLMANCIRNALAHQLQQGHSRENQEMDYEQEL